MLTPSSTRLRSGLALGLSFIIGAAVFGIAFALLSRLRGGEHEPLDPPSQRVAGALEMPLLSPSPSTEPPQVWRLKDHAGKVVLVNYFATWCGPCMQELPDLRALAKEFEPQGVVFVAVALDAPEDATPPTPPETILRQFIKDRDFPFPVVLPSPDSTLMRNRPPVPQTFLYDRQGRRARSMIGSISNRDVKSSLEELLKEP